MDDKTEILGSQSIAQDGPFKISLKMHFVGISGEYEGYDAHADIDLPPGCVPTDDAILKAFDIASEQLGDKFRIATRGEFVKGLLIEQTGVDMNFSIPGPSEFRLFKKENTNV